jgi:conjugal transfer pilus assembly protein TraF
MKRLNLTIAAIIAFSGFTSVLAADKEESMADKKGWHFYKEIDDPELKKTKKPTNAVKTELKAGTTQWYKENIDRLKNIAIENPSEENILNFVLMQKLMMDKATKFSEEFSNIYKKYPQLSSNTPRTQAMVSYDKSASRQVQEQTWHSLKDKMAFYFFFSSSCDFCRKMESGTVSILDKEGFSVVGISLDGKGLKGTRFEKEFLKATEQQIQSLSIERSPTVYAISNTKKLAIVSIGMEQYEAFKKRSLYVAKELGLLSKDEYLATKTTHKSNSEFEAGVDDRKYERAEDLLSEIKSRMKINTTQNLGAKLQ